MKFKTYLGAEKVKELHEKLDQALEAEDGFILIYNGDKSRITDAYKNLCFGCIMEIVAYAVDDADERGMLAIHEGEDGELEEENLRIN